MNGYVNNVCYLKDLCLTEESVVSEENDLEENFLCGCQDNQLNFDANVSANAITTELNLHKGKIQYCPFPWVQVPMLVFFSYIFPWYPFPF